MISRFRIASSLAGLALASPGLFAQQRADQIGAEARVGPGLEHVPGELLVILEPSAPEALRSAAAAAVGARERKRFANVGVELWRCDPSANLGDLRAELASARWRGALRSAEPNYIVHAFQSPNDPLRGELWGLHNLGQSGGIPDADIDALEAHALSEGSSEVVVGVIDSGIDYGHPDLAANIWSNASEAGGIAGVDDDGNGFVDDVRGWDFANDDADPMDDHGHGTHVAGTIAAVGDNGIAVRGVAPRVRLLPLKFLAANGSGSTADAIAAIDYAAGLRTATGARVVRITNNSWGGGRKSSALELSILNAGALFVAAAGNSGSSTKSYPAGYAGNHILSVAASDAADARASFSNYGTSWVDIAAPGVNILSTYPSAGTTSMSGTSMASPHAAGVAALVLSREPALDAVALRARLLATADPLPAWSGLVECGGRLNAARAIGAPALPPDAVAPSAVFDLAADVGAATHSSVRLTWTAPGDDGAIGTAYLYDLRYREDAPVDASNWDDPATYRVEGEALPLVAGSAQSTVVQGLLSQWTYYFALRTFDAAGNASGISNAVMTATAAPANNGWTIETVGPDPSWFYLDVAVSRTSGAVGLATILAGRVVRYRHDGVAWTMDDVGPGEAGVATAFAPDDSPAVVHGWNQMDYYRRTGTAWTRETPDTRCNDEDPGLVFDGQGRALIAYRDQGRAGLRLLTREATQWTSVQASPDIYARWKSLALDANGRPAIAYSDDPDGDGWLSALKLARFDGSQWTRETVESGPQGTGVLPALAFHPVTNHPAILHRPSSGLRLMRWDGSAWALVLSVPEGPYGDLAYTSDGWLRVACCDGNGDLVLFSEGPSGWTQEIVYPEIYGRVALALDAADRPYIAYSGWSGFELAHR
jgi:hypothetical protein